MIGDLCDCVSAEAKGKSISWEIFFISRVSILDVQQLFRKCEQKAPKTKRAYFRKHFIFRIVFKKKERRRKKKLLGRKSGILYDVRCRMQTAKYWKQLHGKNLTIKFECGGILSKMCRE